jgi:sulfate transport system permease protein
LRVQSLYEDPRGQTAAFSIAALLALLALLTLALKTFVEWKTERNYELAQRAPLSTKSEAHV